jgi:hypothetical protein
LWRRAETEIAMSKLLAQFLGRHRTDEQVEPKAVLPLPFINCNACDALLWTIAISGQDVKDVRADKPHQVLRQLLGRFWKQLDVAVEGPPNKLDVVIPGPQAWFSVVIFGHCVAPFVCGCVAVFSSAERPAGIGHLTKLRWRKSPSCGQDLLTS